MSTSDRSRLYHQGRALCEALHGTWSTDHGMCRCPSHDDRNPSLSVRVGRKALLFTCHAGCKRSDVLAVLRPHTQARPLSQRWEIPLRNSVPSTSAQWCRALWERAKPLQGSPAEAYLRSRGLSAPEGTALRYLPRCHHRPTGKWYPALLAPFQLPDGQITALTRMYLDADRHCLIPHEPRRTVTNPPGAGAMHAGPANTRLGLAEGLETALAAHQLHQCSVWAAGSSGRLHQLAIPDLVTHLILFADNDAAGRRAAALAKAAYQQPGRVIEICYPPPPWNDWNDVIRQQANPQAS